MGVINYYHRFLPAIAPKLVPLHAASAGRGKDITLTSQYQNAFEEAKASLSTNTRCQDPMSRPTLQLMHRILQLVSSWKN